MARKPTAKTTSPKKPAATKAAPKKKVSTKPKGKVVKGEIDTTTAEEQIEKLEQKQIVSSTVLDKAISELVKYVAANSKPEENKLFDDESSNLYLQATTKKFYSDRPNLKPKTIKVPHSIFDLETIKVCLFIRDNIISEDILEKIEESEIVNLKKIITLKDLKGEYKQYEAKRKLLNEYDLFLTDDSLMNSLPKALGKIFYQSAKYPLPIKVAPAKAYKDNKLSISVDTLKNQITKSLSSVSFLPPMGVNVSIKFGNSSFEPSKLTENITEIIKFFDATSLRQLAIKTETSPSIPIFFAKDLYNDEDILTQESKQVKESDDNDEKFTGFEKALLELAAPEQVAKILGRKMGKINKKKSIEKKTNESNGVKKVVKSKKPTKVTKISKK